MSTLASLRIPQGFDYEQTLTVSDQDGNAINLTGCTVTFHLFAPGATTEAITPAPSLTLVTPAAGVAKVVLTDTQTATLTALVDYRYGVKIIDGTGLKTPPVYGMAFIEYIPGA